MFRAVTSLFSFRGFPNTKSSGLIGLPSSCCSSRFSSVEMMGLENEVDLSQYLHHGKRPRFRDRPKFKSPRKRASKLLLELQTEAIQRSKESNPQIWSVPFKVGDAIEFEVADGGVMSETKEKMRGMVLGIFRKGLDHSVLIRDMLFTVPVERLIPLHSPLLRSVRIIKSNFLFKGKRKVKRAKLYYLRDENPLITMVTKPSK